MFSDEHFGSQVYNTVVHMLWFIECMYMISQWHRLVLDLLIGSTSSLIDNGSCIVVNEHEINNLAWSSPEGIGLFIIDLVSCDVWNREVLRLVLSQNLQYGKVNDMI
jgi:hypothetical protein